MNMLRRFTSPFEILRLTIPVMAIIAITPLISARAEASDTNSGATNSTANSATPSATTSAPELQGNIVEVGMTLNNLRDARLSVSRVRKATANLYDEVTRQQMTMDFNPNVIGTTVIMTPRPSFSGPLLPARKKWVDASMAEIRPIINLFKEDVDVAIETDRRTDVSDKTKKSLDTIRTEAFDQIKKSFDDFTKLEVLTNTSNYDNSAIASEVTNLDNQMKSLDRTLKKGITILQRESKAAKKGKSA